MKMFPLSYRTLKSTLMAGVIAAAALPATSFATLLDDCYTRTQSIYKTATKKQDDAYTMILNGKKKSKTFDADGKMATANGIAKNDLNNAKAAIGTAVKAVGDPVVKNRAEYDALDQKKAAACKSVEDGKLATAAQAAYSNYSSVKSAYDNLK